MTELGRNLNCLFSERNKDALQDSHLVLSLKHDTLQEIAEDKDKKKQTKTKLCRRVLI